MWKWERREKKRTAKASYIPKHGKGFIRAYKEAVLGRLQQRKDKILSARKERNKKQ